jgi:hypothetical protein
MKAFGGPEKGLFTYLQQGLFTVITVSASTPYRRRRRRRLRTPAQEGFQGQG